MIVIVNYETGNVNSILNMLKKIGVDAEISGDVRRIEEADKIILPGVGSFDFGMKNLQKSGLTAVLNKKVLQQKTPILGICLGMQLMTRKSEEGALSGFGWIDAETKRFRSEGSMEGMKIPHMGWNTVRVCKGNSIIPDKRDLRFYFVHSYHVVCSKNEDVLTVTSYGPEFVSAFKKENIIGMQFHPEKSHKFGMEVMSNFSRL